ncbi:lipocalin family protein [Xylophilus sp. GOD-11R]|uniref:lipocalin family protein n=1 Tax=Xylophilus sp. GOD-11R TaxID=3089814 RepID=UPI00298C1270|nr:lipocalin family protein [Xylophilus sp. GOD-11R]WPB56632.1 lipocalin family protein [Xylophilus sp. GOD-11R]
MNKHHFRLAAGAGFGFAAVFLLNALRGGPRLAEVAPVPLAVDAELPRYMGPWHVIARIPACPDGGIRDAIETYSLADDGGIDLEFRSRTERDGGFRKVVSRAVVSAGDDAVWEVRGPWSGRWAYRIAYVSPDYSAAIVACGDRQEVRVLARTPAVSEARFQMLVGRVGAMGFDVSRVERVGQNASR